MGAETLDQPQHLLDTSDVQFSVKLQNRNHMTKQTTLTAHRFAIITKITSCYVVIAVAMRENGNL